MSDFDPRITPARLDVAAAHLKGKVDAARYEDGGHCRVHVPFAPIRKSGAYDAPQLDQARYGEKFVIYDRAGDWVWGQVERPEGTPGYVGYVLAWQLVQDMGFSPTHIVSAMRAPIFSGADIKAPVLGYMMFLAELESHGEEGGFIRLSPEPEPGMPKPPAVSWLHKAHLKPVGTQLYSDYVTAAEAHFGVPYVWGGVTPQGLDCSGLVQSSLMAAGQKCPRDSDQQQAALGEAIDIKDVRRGDLVFWKGHVGIMRDETHLLHANAFHMKTASEPLSEAVKRLKDSGLEVTAVKRL